MISVGVWLFLHSQLLRSTLFTTYQTEVAAVATSRAASLSSKCWVLLFLLECILLALLIPRLHVLKPQEWRSRWPQTCPGDVVSQHILPIFNCFYKVKCLLAFRCCGWKEGECSLSTFPVLVFVFMLSHTVTVGHVSCGYSEKHVIHF